MNTPARKSRLRPFLGKALHCVMLLFLVQWSIGNFVNENGWQPILGMGFALVATLVVTFGAMGTAHYFDRNSPETCPTNRS